MSTAGETGAVRVPIGRDYLNNREALVETETRWDVANFPVRSPGQLMI